MKAKKIINDAIELDPVSKYGTSDSILLFTKYSASVAPDKRGYPVVLGIGQNFIIDHRFCKTD